MRARGARKIAALALLAGLCGAVPALAQSGETRLINTPAETFAMAPGGVDLRTGRYVYKETDLAIGGGALTLTRTLTQSVAGHANPFGNLSHNWDIMITERRINGENPPAPGQDYQINVHFAGRSQTYRGRHNQTGFEQVSGGGFAPLTYAGDRAGAAVVYTYRAADGTVAVFRPLGAQGSGDCSAVGRCAYVAQITDPDGTVYIFDYWSSGGTEGGSARLARVTSSRGYVLLLEGIEHRVTKSCVINLALAPAPANGQCPANALAGASYSYSAVNGFPAPTYRLAGATGPDNATSGFTYGTGTMGFVRPGESAPWLVNGIGGEMDEEGVAQEVVTSQSLADGQTYQYDYGRAPVTNNNPNPTIAGGGYVHNGGGLSSGLAATYAWPLRPGSGNPGSPCTPFCPLDQPDDFQNYVYQQTPGPVEVTDAAGRTTIFDYCDPVAMAGLPANENNRCYVQPLVSFTDPEGARTELQYDGNRNITRVTRHPRPGSAQPNGQPWPAIVTSAVYDIANPRSSSKPLSMTDAMGNITNYTYAPEHGGLLTQTGPPPAPGGVRPQTRHSYAQRSARLADGSALTPIWLRVASSLCRTSAATGNPSSPCAAAGDEVLTQYDYGPESGPNTLLLRGQTVTATDGGAVTILRTCYAYDALGRRISETQSNANLASCPAAPPAAAMPYTASTRYDISGRVTGTIAPDPDGGGPLRHAAVRNSYDPAGRLVKVETGELSAWQSEAVAPSAWSGFTIFRTLDTAYDMMGRKIRESQRHGDAAAIYTLTQTSYDGLGRPDCTAVRMNQAAFGSPPASACAQGPQGAHGPDRITRNVYDAAGQRLQVRAGVGTEVEGATTTWAYNGTGQVTTLIDGSGNRAQLVYDGHGRQTCWMFPSTTRPSAYNDATHASALASAGVLSGAITGGECSSGDYELYGYDPNGNRTSLRKRDGVTLTYQYDALGRVTVKIVPERPAPHPYPLTAAQTRDVYYGYDLRNLQLFARFDSTSGEGVTSQYDGFGRLALSTIVMDGTAHSFAYHYDRNGNRIWFDGTSGYYSARTYDGLDRVTSVVDPHGTVVRIGYDAAGRRSGLDSGLTPTSATSLGYDGIGRLASLGHDFAGTGNDVAWSYARNPASGIASVTRDNDSYAWTSHYAVQRAYTTNGLNQYTNAGSAGFTYDANGNLITSPGPAQNEVLTYTYDVENRLVGRTSTGASPAVTLAYDPLGRLWRVQGAAGTTRFLYDGDALAVETDGAGGVLRAFAHGPGSDEPLVWYEVPGGWRRLYPRADHQGSIVAASGDDGALALINRYDEYGIPAGTNTGRFQYTGQIWLPELGMYHYKARVYSPTLGRFLQTDPIGYEDQYNLYAYVGNDPLNNNDPSGQCSAGAVRTGGLIALADGPEPGPTDVVGAGIVVGDCFVRGVRAIAGALGLVGETSGDDTSDGVARIVANQVVQQVAQQAAEQRAEDRRRRSAPTNAPRRTRPINQAGIDRQGIHDIKDGIGAAPDDYVGITPDGTIITTDPQTGEARDHGNISDHDVERDRPRQKRDD